jgi:hypothetical protein
VTTDAQIEDAIRRARVFAKYDHHVTRVSYSPRTDRFQLRMDNGVTHSIPRKLLQGLHDASAAELSQIEIVGLGTGLYWPALDVAHLVSGVLSGVYGSEKWMRQLEHETGREKISA